MCMQLRNDLSDNAWHWLLGAKWHSRKLKEAIPGWAECIFLVVIWANWNLPIPTKRSRVEKIVEAKSLS